MRYDLIIRSGSIAWSSFLFGRGVRVKYPVACLSECVKGNLYLKDILRKIYLITESDLITLQQLA